MFQKILVAIDDSAQSKQVLDQAIALAKTYSASLMISHTISHFSEGYPTSVVSAQSKILPGFDRADAIQSYFRQWEEFEQKDLNRLKALTEQVTAQGTAAEFTQSVGDPGQAICDLARSWDADLIVLGHRGLKGVKALFMGSVSSYVQHHAPCSVLTVHLQPEAE